MTYSSHTLSLSLSLSFSLSLSRFLSPSLTHTFTHGGMQAMVDSMKAGSVTVDLAAATGGNIATTRADQVHRETVGRLHYPDDDYKCNLCTIPFEW